MPPTIAARCITCEQPRSDVRTCAGSRRSPVWTSQPSRIQSGAGRWSDTRTSKTRVAEQAAHRHAADRAGATGDQDAAYARSAAISFA